MIVLVVDGEYCNMLGLLIGGSKNIHREARDWANRVYLNGGRVSNSTLKAVSDFCMRIDSAGIRDRFIRLNLFCGSNLNSVMVPLYTSLGFKNNLIGNYAIDINTSFIASDYNETGNSGGLKSDNSYTKGIDTTIFDTTFELYAPSQDAHMSLYVNTYDPSGENYLMGLYDFCNCNDLYISAGTTSAVAEMFGDCGSSNTTNAFASTSTGLVTVSSYSTSITLYMNNTLFSTSTTVLNNPTQGNDTLRVFGLFYQDGNCFGTNFYGSNIRCSGYSFGKGLSASQVSSYNEAMKQFQTALGRNV